MRSCRFLVIFFCCLESNRCALYHLDLVYIRNPARGWNDDFITWIDDRSKEALYKNVLKFRIGEEHKLEDVKQKLIDLGYVRYDLIDGRGQFSVRGRNCRCINNREKRNKNRILGR